MIKKYLILNKLYLWTRIYVYTHGLLFKTAMAFNSLTLLTFFFHSHAFFLIFSQYSHNYEKIKYFFGNWKIQKFKASLAALGPQVRTSWLVKWISWFSMSTWHTAMERLATWRPQLRLCRSNTFGKSHIIYAVIRILMSRVRNVYNWHKSKNETWQKERDSKIVNRNNIILKKKK